MKRHKRPGMSRGGFTLLEIIIALAILSISLTTLLSANNRASLMTAEAGLLTDAVTLAREEMENMYLGVTPQPGVSDIQEREDYPRFQWRTEVSETPFDRALEVAIRVFHAGDKKERSLFTLRAYVLR